MVATASAQSWNQPAKAQAQNTPQVNLADLPYTNNVAQNPGFERGLEKDPSKGWFEQASEGAEIKMISAAPNAAAGSVQPATGRKALKIAIKKPAKYTGKQINGSWSEFLTVRPVAGGVSQIIPVKGGAEYALKFDWCGTGFFDQDTAAGPDRGIMTAGIYLQWLGKDKKNLSGEKLDKNFLHAANAIMLNSQAALASGSETWKTYAFPKIPAPEDLVSGKAKKPGFIKAPPTAAFVKIRLGLASQNAKARPALYIDNFVWAENPQVAEPAPKQAAPAAPAAAKQ